MTKIKGLLLAIIVSFFCNPTIAQPRIDSLRALLSSAKADSYKIELLFQLTTVSANCSNKDASAFAAQAIDLAKELKSPSYIAKAYLNAAKINNDTATFQNSVNNLNEALKYSNLTSDLVLIAQILNNLGKVYLTENLFPKSFEYFIKSLKISENIDNKFLLIDNYTAIGLIYQNQKYYKYALDYFKKAETLCNKTGNLAKLANVYNSIGDVLGQTGEINKAIDYISKALRIHEYNNNQKGIAKSFSTIAAMYHKIGNDEIAMVYNLRSLDIWNTVPTCQNEIAETYIQLSENYVTINKYDDALKYILLADKIADKLHSLSLRKNTAFDLSDLYAKQKQFDKAYTQYVIYKNLNDSLYSKENAEKISSIQLQFQFEKKEELMNIREQQKDIIQNARFKKQAIYLFIGLVLIVGLVILVIFILRSNRAVKRAFKLLNAQKMQIDKQAHHIQQKNDELEMKNVEIVDKNEELLQQKEELVALSERLSTTNKELQLQKAEITVKNMELLQQTGLLEMRSRQLEDALEEVNLQTEELQTQTESLEIANNELQLHEEKLIEQSRQLESANRELCLQQEELQTQTELLEYSNHELEKLSVVASHTQNAVVIANANGEIEWANDAFTTMQGYSLEEFVEKHGRRLDEVSANSQIQHVIEECISEHKSVKYQVQNKTKFGKEIWTQTTLSPVMDEDGTLRQLVAIDADITEIILAEQEIERQNRDITDSIKYARRIQSAMLPLDLFVDALFTEYFVLNKPCDILSGDFYWVTFKNKKAIVAVGDCTGHGVPGAMMSMLGIAFLKEIINTLQNLNPAEILNRLRELVIKALHQRGKDGETKDGMDISICIIDTEKRKLQYAGANSPAYIIRGNKHQADNEQILNGDIPHPYLQELKPDKMPIGIHHNDKIPFTTQTVQLESNDRLYCFTDGYSSQFGSEKDCKFLTKRFRSLLLDIHHESMCEQKRMLNETINNWVGHRKLVDDIMVMGIRI